MQHRTLFIAVGLLAFDLSCKDDRVLFRDDGALLEDAGGAGSGATPDAGDLVLAVPAETDEAVPGDAPPDALVSGEVLPGAAPPPAVGDGQLSGIDLTDAGGPGEASGPAPLLDAGLGESASDAGGELEAPPSDCTGCARLAVPSNLIADYQLGFDGARDLSGSRIVWRVRVRNTAGSVDVAAYAQSDQADELVSQIRRLSAAQDWQEISLDLGATAGVNVEIGAFDPTQVERVGFALQPALLPGEFAAAVLEVDSVRFSSTPELDTDFASSDGGLVLVDSAGASVSHVPE